VSVLDAANQEWRVKWGQEVHTEVFGTRLAWALGYFAEPTYFVRAGSIEDTRELRRARPASMSWTASRMRASS
jgi:Na+/proline symporter